MMQSCTESGQPVIHMIHSSHHQQTQYCGRSWTWISPEPIFGIGTCSWGPPYPALPRILGQAGYSLDRMGQKRLQRCGSQYRLHSPISHFPNACASRARSSRKLCVTHMENPAASLFAHDSLCLSLFLSHSAALLSNWPGDFSFLFLIILTKLLFSFWEGLIRHWPDLCAPISEYISWVLFLVALGW